jgi:glutamate-1-semialdehyde 2,1-aminomutase
MNAGLVGLTELYTPERAAGLNASGDRLRERLNTVVQRHGIAMQFTGLGSMLSVHMTDGPIRSQEDAERGNAALRDLFWFDLVERGIWFAKRGMFALSIALDVADHDKLVEAVEEFAQTRAPLFEAIGSG